MIPSGFWKALRQAHDTQRWPLYLVGDAGTGKTTAAAFAYLGWPGRDAMFRPFGNICDILMRCRRDYDGYTEYVQGVGVTWSEASFWAAIEKKDLVVVDEIGTRPDLDTRVGIITELMERRKRRPTIFTGNIAIEKLEATFDARVSSRIAEGSIHLMGGDDLRFQGIKQRITRSEVGS